MTEDGQGEGRLGHEDVAGDRHEGVAGGVGRALVVAAHHDAAAARIPARPARCRAHARPVPGAGVTPSIRSVSPQPSGCCARPGPVLAHPGAHERERGRAGQHRAMAGPGVVGMGMGDDGAIHRPHGVDEEAARARSTGPAGVAFSQV